jgi:hypothetical protein
MKRMTLRDSYKNLTQERLRIHGDRMEILARIEHLSREAEALLKIETDLMRMQDNMQVQARYQQGTEARQ